MASTSSYAYQQPHPYANADAYAPDPPQLPHPPPFGPLPVPPPTSALPPPPTSSLPPLPSEEPYARQRGESSPVQSRHREPFDARGLDGPDGGQRRKSSSSTPRRIVDGREETREERRARKERERAARADEGAESSPTSRRPRSRPSELASPVSPLDPTASTSARPGSPASASSTITPRSPPATSSKSVLTIALQRAQSAVLLDSANNVPAAIAAYTQSVRLLKDVMVRVEEGSRRERERDRESRDGETEEQVERRRARTERRERMKVDEARRLKVIHDTYEDRIKMLLAMGADELSAPGSPSTPTTQFQTSSTPPFTPASQQSSSLSAISTPLPYASPATTATPSSPPRTLGLQTSTDDWSEGIGSAMLLGSPPPSPMDPMMPAPTEPPPLRSGAESLAPPEMRRRPSIADETIAEGNEGEDSYIVYGDDDDEDETDSTTTAPAPARYSSSGTDDDGAVPVTALDFGGHGDIHWPRDHDRLAQSHPSPRRPPPIEEPLRDSFASMKLDPLPPLPPAVARPAGVGHRAYASTGSGLLVRETTDLGTISRRRRSPNLDTSATDDDALQGPEGLWGAPVEDESDLDDLRASDDGTRPASIVVRPASSDLAKFEFGQAYPLQPVSAGPSYASASLPTRLRTASQPGKRPTFGSHDSAPALPPLQPTSTAPRKGSVPTPTSLFAPPYPSLNRSSSHSSQGSISDREPQRGGPSPNPSTRASSALSSHPDGRTETPTSSSFPRPSHASAASSAAGAYLLHPPPPEPSFAPVPPLRRPFHLMRQVLQSIEQGAYVTPRLYVPKQMWAQTGVKLVAVETKVRMLDLLLTGLEGVEKAGDGLIRRQDPWHGSLAKSGAANFAKELEDLEGLMGGIQSTLAKKLGYGTSGKKTGGTTFSAWSSKLSRSLDRVTNGRSLDSPATYIDGVTRVFRIAQSIDNHLVALAADDYAYSDLGQHETQRIERGLRRASDFFGQVICQFILRDLGIFLDKYVKRGGAWVGGE